MPLILFLIIFITVKLQAFSFFSSAPQFTIMLEPAGDAHHPGRKIDETYERSLTLLCAEELKNRLEHRYPNMRVLLTRTAGETVQPLQNANFANRIGVDCYLSINFYKETSRIPSLSLYYFSYGNDFIIKTFDLAFYEYDQAHLAHLPTTHKWSSFMRQVLELATYKTQFNFKGVFKIPFKPLIGITAPAFAFEAGLINKEGWIQLVEPIVASLDPLIKSQC